jgi:biopolymer transport protein ExbD
LARTRNFRRHRQSNPISEMNLTNLIDLGFTLLIIFMIATPLINQEQTIPVNLPVESKSSQIKPDKNTQFVAITLKADGSYYIDHTRVGFTDLELRLRALGVNPRDTVIRIRADSSVQYQKIITLMDELKKNNLSKITFDTQSGT